MHPRIAAALCLCVSFPFVQGAPNETVWSVVIYNLYGERTPLVLPAQTILTPHGAQQAYAAGAFFRDRYVSQGGSGSDINMTIDGISAETIDNSQTFVFSTLPEYTVASAQAFMQGLYPPKNISSSTTLDDMAILANGTVEEYPLQGYQYVQIQTASASDPNIIYIAGDENCPAHDSATIAWSNSPQYQQIRAATLGFYKGFEASILNGVFLDSDVSFDSAYPIFDYLSYGYVHNQSIKEALNDQDLARAHALADRWLFATNGNTSGNSIQTIAGQTLVAEIGGLLLSNIETQGSESKLNALFGSFEPMIAFSALTQLTKANKDFNGLPDPGSSMVFEMFTNDTATVQGYPDIDDLQVRFLFRNGTNSSTGLTVYPLFGNSDEQNTLSLSDFLNQIANFSKADVDDWCNTCGSISITPFCSASNSSSSNGTAGPIHTSTHKQMKPVIAGVIGAFIALAFVGVLLASSAFFVGARVHRTAKKQKTDLGGFKGSEKLASDQDLPSGPTTTAGATVVGSGERVRSWEMNDRKDAQNDVEGSAGPRHLSAPTSGFRLSFEGDDLDIHREPTKADERI